MDEIFGRYVHLPIGVSYIEVRLAVEIKLNVTFCEDAFFVCSNTSCQRVVGSKRQVLEVAFEHTIIPPRLAIELWLYHLGVKLKLSKPIQVRND